MKISQRFKIVALSAMVLLIGALYASKANAETQLDLPITPRIILANYTTPNTQTILASSTLTLRWLGINLSSSTIDVEMVSATGSVYTIARVIANDGQENIQLPTTLTTGLYTLRLRTTGGTISVTSPTRFRVTMPIVQSLTITAPTASTEVIRGSRVTVSWTSSNIPVQTMYNVYLVASSTNTVLVNYGPRILGASSGSISLLIPSSITAGQYRIRAAGVNSVTATSPAFTVKVATTTATTTVRTFTFTNLNTNTSVRAGTMLPVSWTSTNIPNQTQAVVKLVAANGTIFDTVFSGPLATQGSGTVFIPSNVLPGQYQLKWFATVGGVALTATSSLFTVTPATTLPPQVAIISPTYGSTIRLSQNPAMTLSWNPINIPANTLVTFKLIRSSDGVEVKDIFSTQLQNINAIQYSALTGIPTGIYKIKAVYSINGTAQSNVGSPFYIAY